MPHSFNLIPRPLGTPIRSCVSLIFLLAVFSIPRLFFLCRISNALFRESLCDIFSVLALPVFMVEIFDLKNSCSFSFNSNTKSAGNFSGFFLTASGSFFLKLPQGPFSEGFNRQKQFLDVVRKRLKIIPLIEQAGSFIFRIHKQSNHACMFRNQNRPMDRFGKKTSAISTTLKSRVNGQAGQSNGWKPVFRKFAGI